LVEKEAFPLDMWTNTASVSAQYRLSTFSFVMGGCSCGEGGQGFPALQKKIEEEEEELYVANDPSLNDPHSAIQVASTGK
jgi:hypothetical protein